MMLVFLIGFALWTPFRQADEIEKFTKPTPRPTPIADANPADAENLKSRLKSFREALDNPQQNTRIALNADDLNRAIATFEPLAELRGTFWVEEIHDDHIQVSICYQLNGRPRLTRDDEPGFITSDPRYLIGKIQVRPELTKRELVLTVQDLNVPNKTIPEGFMGHFSTLRIFEQFIDDEQIGGGMATLTDTRLANGQLILERNPDAAVPGVVSDDDFLHSGGKIAMFLGGAIILFLIFAGSVLFIGYRTQLRKLQATEKNSSPTNKSSSEPRSDNSNH